MGIKISQEELEKHLWEASNILRGSVDASEYKHYIFSLLFLKRLNDVFEEEIEKKIQHVNNSEKDKLDNYAFFIPKQAQWPALNASSLMKACDVIEKHNPVLKGVLTGISFDISDRLSNETVNHLIRHFSNLRLRNCDLTDPDILGRAYEYLIAQFAESAGKKGGEFYTPHMVVRLLVELLSPEEGMCISDPTVGSGGMLIQCVEYIKRNGGNWLNLSLYGQEKNIHTWSICIMNMVLHGIANFKIKSGDTIRNPKLIEDDQLILFDIVIANPPFSLAHWGIEIAKNDSYNRFKYGIPPKSYGDMAFLQHMLATLQPNGRMGAIFPHGILFRGGNEKKIRKALVDNDLIEAIIGIAPNLFYGTSIPAAIVLLNKKKHPDRKNKILFIDAFQLYKEERSKNILQEEDIAKIVMAFKNFNSIKRFSRVASLREIREYGYNLNIPLYIETTVEDDPKNISQLNSDISELKKLDEKQKDINQKIDDIFNGFEESLMKNIPDTWRKVYLGEFVELETGKRAKGGALKEGVVASIGGEHINDSGQILWTNIKFIPEEFYDKNLSQGKVQLNDILVVKDGATTGKVGLVRDLPYEKIAVNEHIFIVRSKDREVLDNYFLFYLLFSSICQNQIKKRFHGVVGGINRSDFNTIQIFLPPLSEQKDIVNILSAIDTKLITTQKIIEKTTYLKQVFLQQILTAKIRRRVLR